VLADSTRGKEKKKKHDQEKGVLGWSNKTLRMPVVAAIEKKKKKKE